MLFQAQPFLIFSLLSIVTVLISSRNENHVQGAIVPVGSTSNKTYFWDNEDFNSTWIDSVSKCHKEGLYIATIETEVEQLLLQTVGVSRNWTKYLNIGGTDLFSEETWRWIRSGNPITYSNWYPGSPYPDPDGRNWNCMGLDPGANWTWVDIGCNEYFVMTLCEFP
ncbi:perlucin-like protein [Folsomia candida]|uniref:perlucin-like protein n=1 Tax=Folsomia candida TaxID=158441 RepID=UPI0016054638|nr:perlucin-like protein [Folsomia candida]